MPDGATTTTNRPGSKRRIRILDAAADLLSQNGFHSVSMADIGAIAGISGPAIYRHFSSKSALLVMLFDQAIDGLLEQAKATLSEGLDHETALERLVAGQVEFVVSQRQLAIVYYNEINNLPAEDRHRLRTKQGTYLNFWIDALLEDRPDLDEQDARTMVHSAVGAIQSSLGQTPSVPTERLRALLLLGACAVLECDIDHTTRRGSPSDVRSGDVSDGGPDARCTQGSRTTTAQQTAVRHHRTMERKR